MQNHSQKPFVLTFRHFLRTTIIKNNEKQKTKHKRGKTATRQSILRLQRYACLDFLQFTMTLFGRALYFIYKCNFCRFKIYIRKKWDCVQRLKVIWSANIPACCVLLNARYKSNIVMMLMVTNVKKDWAKQNKNDIFIYQRYKKNT